jgi:hypothetical protein
MKKRMESMMMIERKPLLTIAMDRNNNNNIIIGCPDFISVENLAVVEQKNITDTSLIRKNSNRSN